jgi:hypothetical protein
VVVAVLAVIAVAAVVVVVADGDDNDGELTTSGVALGGPVGEPLGDLGMPADLIEDAGRVRALLTEDDPVYDGGLGFDTAVDPAQIVVLVRDPDAVREALEAEMTDPARLRVEEATFTDAEVRALNSALDPIVRGAGNVGFGRVAQQVELWERQEALAAQLVLEHGPAVLVSVGGFPFPYVDDNECPSLPPPPPPGVAVELEVLTPQVSLDGHAITRVTVTNRSHQDVGIREPQAGPGVWRGFLVLPGTDQVVAAPVGGQFSTQEGPHNIVLREGQSVAVGAAVSRATCHVTPTVGTTLPTGHYELVAEVTQPDGATFRSPPVPIEIVATAQTPEAAAANGPARALEPPTQEQAALADRFRSFAATPTAETLAAVPVGPTLGVYSNGGTSGGEASQFAGDESWPRGPDALGRTNILDVVAAHEALEVTVGPPRWCGGDLLAEERDLFYSASEDVDSITIEPASPTSCDEWFAVSLFVVDDGTVGEIHTFTWVPS